jgi:oleate hydratase
MEKLTGNVTGTGGLVTFADSRWMLSVVMFHQPHFCDQADKTYVFWGYGLRGDRSGNFVRKPMWQCSGNEILTELAGHLRLNGSMLEAFGEAIVITCRMP